ncbi:MULTISPECIES: hypothetical protein [unclassified Romboutsia]|uniref:hypothetical protein n=1 Tax=unclassified Romboutsia TaxID=2626894 RepID=UPI0008209BBC|nr:MULTISPECIES: hypothetical protein [unclassified Romboutsia]SCI16556.1 Uncharacterised protein [uncultured Clostridium sp.]
MNDNNHDFKNLDYEKLNSLLANQEFASWYYEKMSDKSKDDISIEDFVGILQDYSNNHFE